MKITLGNYETKRVVFENKKDDGASIVVFGATGTRKSTTIHDISLQIIEEGGTVLAFDTLNVLQSDYIFCKLREQLNRVTVDYDIQKHGIIVDLFQPLVYPDGSVEPARETIDSVCEIISSSFKLGSAQTMVLHDALEILSERHLYDKEGICALQKVLLDLEEQKATDVYRKLSYLIRYNLLQLGKLRLEKEKFNVYRLSKFPLVVQRIVINMTLKLIYRYAVNGEYRENPIFIFIDEFQENSVTSPDGIVATLLTQGRKYGVNLILCGQTLPKEREFCSKLLQSALLLVFEPSTADVTRISRMIEPAHPHKWLDILPDLAPGHFITVGPVKVGERIITKKPLHVEARMNKTV